MNILVCIKQVPDETVRVSLKPGEAKPDVSEIGKKINAFDACGIEMAAKYIEKEGGKLAVCSVGDEEVEFVLKRALSVGAKYSFRIPSRSKGGELRQEENVTASLIRDAIPLMEKEIGGSFDMIICGRESTDILGGQVGPLLSAMLDIPFVYGLVEIEKEEDSKAHIKIEGEGGYSIISEKKPLLCTVVRPDYGVRFPTLMDRMSSMDAVIPVADAGTGDNAAKEITGYTAPPAKREGTIIEEKDPEKAVAMAMEIFRKRDLGSDDDNSGADTAAYSNVLLCDIPLADETALSEILALAADDTGKRLIVLKADRLGKRVAPMLAHRMDTACANDVSSYTICSDHIKAVRSVYAGAVSENVRLSQRAVISVRSSVFDKLKEDGAMLFSSTVFAKDKRLTEAASAHTVLERQVSTERVINIEDEETIVCVGRGIAYEEDLYLGQDLADAMGGVLCGTLPIVENGWISKDRQVGQSGKTVSPNIYVAAGISGMPQHLVGMADSKYIIALNFNTDAPIFQVADLGIVGNIYKLLPALTNAFKNESI